MQAVILAGGKGTRLADRLQGRPKPLVDVEGIPLLERQITALKVFGVDNVIVLVNHLADQVEAFCEARGKFGLHSLILVDDGQPKGTAGAVLSCLEQLDERFLVVYGDTLFNIDVQRFLKDHATSGADATLFLHPNDHPFDSDLVEVEDGWISAFRSKPHRPGMYLPNLVNAAFYAVERRALEAWRGFPVPADFGQDLFPAMLRGGAALRGYISFEYIKDLGTPKRLDKVSDHLRRGVVARATLDVRQACVFVDRDGTLNALRDYVRTPEELEVFTAVPAAVRRLNDAEYRVAVVTNQPVIARGECSFEGLRSVHAKLDTALGSAGAFADRLYFCPHHPDSGFPGEIRALKIECGCRKPSPGMILQAARDMNADLSRSWMIGDSTSDVMAARNAGVRSIMVLTGEGGRDGKYPARPDFIVPDFVAAVTFTLDIYPALAAHLAALADETLPGDFIRIGGAARSGKSTVAAVLAHEIRTAGLDAVTLPLDAWLRPESDRGEGMLGRFDIDTPTAGIRSWLDGGPASIDVPFYDRVRRQRRDGELVRLRADTVVIFEGVPALVPTLETPRRTRRIQLRADETRRRERVVVDLMHRGHGDRVAAERVSASRSTDEAEVVHALAVTAGTIVDLDVILAGLDTAP